MYVKGYSRDPFIDMKQSGIIDTYFHIINGLVYKGLRQST